MVCAAAVQKPTLRRRAGNAEKCGYNTPTQCRESPPHTIAHTQSELAEYLNVTRPALSKEINKMTKEGIILMTGKKIEVLNEAALKEYI